MGADWDSLENAIGYRFADREILRRALTHSSHVHEKILAGQKDCARDNEQLEFLGDSVLGLLVSELLVKRFPDYPEGRLSKLKAHLASAAYLYEVAQRLELGNYLQLGRGEEMSGGREKRTLLADALEALIAAVYLDGGLEQTRAFVRQQIVALPEEDFPQDLIDFKSALQELTQARRLPQPRYAIVREQGPEHSKTFTIEARVGRDLVSHGEGSTKKGAAQKAAREIYQRLVSTTE
jgi:ribonuclease-3